MIITFDNMSVIDDDICALHDEHIEFVLYHPCERKLEIKLKGFNGETTTHIKFYDVQYVKFDNQDIDCITTMDDINGWATIPTKEITSFHHSNIFGVKEPISVMFEFFCMSKLYVISSEIRFMKS